MLSPILIPEAKPTRKVKGYQMAETKENLVSCVLVAEHLSRSRHDWTSTVFLATRMSSRFGDLA